MEQMYNDVDHKAEYERIVSYIKESKMTVPEIWSPEFEDFMKWENLPEKIKNDFKAENIRYWNEIKKS